MNDLSKAFALMLMLSLVLVCGSRMAQAETVTPRRDLVDFNGARDISAAWRTELTDASPVAAVTFTTDQVNDVVIDVITDKGGTLTIIPLIDSGDLLVEGQPSTNLVIPVGGGFRREMYTKISAPNTIVVFTKTEAGDTSGFLLFAKGTGR